MKHTLHQIELKNSARLLAINVPNSPALIIRNVFRAGYKYSDPSKYELPHLLEHLAFDSNTTYKDPQDFMFDIERIGAYSNAHTSRDSVWYDFDVNINDIDNVFDLLFAQVDKPLFLQKHVKHEKNVIINELSRDLEDDQNQCSWQLNQVYQQNYPTIQERIDCLADISGQDIRDYHESTHTAQNMSIVVAGEISKKISQIETKLNQGVSKMQQGKTINYRSDFVLPTKPLTQVYSEAKLESLSHFYIQFVHEKIDRKYGPVLRILDAMYNTGYFSRLHDKARKAGLTYGVDSNFYITRENSGYWIADDVPQEKILKLFELCLSELHDLLSGNFTDKEFGRAKDYFLHGFDLSFQTAASYASHYRGRFADEEEPETPESYLAKMLKVTREDISALKKPLFDEAKIIVSVVGTNFQKEANSMGRIVKKYFG